MNENWRGRKILSDISSFEAILKICVDIQDAPFELYNAAVA